MSQQFIFPDKPAWLQLPPGILGDTLRLRYLRVFSGYFWHSLPRNQTIGTISRVYGVGTIHDIDNNINILLYTLWYNQRIRFPTIVEKLRFDNLGT